MSGEHVSAIIAEYNRATPDQLDAGRDWYPKAGRIVAQLAYWAGVEPTQMGAAISALSPRNPWAWNVQDAAAFGWAARHGEPMPVATTYGANRRRAWGFLTGSTDWQGSALKVRAFTRAIDGDGDAVVVDVWAVRVATEGRRQLVESDADYRELAEAYREAARQLGEPSARDLQAIVWVSAQTRGLGSHRRGRHDAVAKRGTFEVVAVALGLPYQRELGL